MELDGGFENFAAGAIALETAKAIVAFDRGALHGSGEVGVVAGDAVEHAPIVPYHHIGWFPCVMIAVLVGEMVDSLADFFEFLPASFVFFADETFGHPR